ncbi:MAG: Gfo/Idh/MocA family oxidoreductase [Caldilineaceae bacterium]|jgi:predicted dehydrogenase|nr:Gfo/Idh/MocA family oxidoreductase [Caldilineaceae bacterium]
MNNYVRLGIVGAGSIALRGHFPHLTMADVRDRVRITAVCDPVLARAQAAAAKYNVPAAYATLEELLAAGDVDAVSLCSPIGVHYEQGMLAVEQGVHVHFNKSMTTTVDEANRLIDAAQAKGVKLVASPGEMLRPRHQRIKQLIDEGALGRLTWAVTGSAFGTYHEDESSVRSGDDPLTNINPAWYFRKPGGGPLYDMTVYGLHAMTGILGPAKRVTAFSGVRVHEREFRGQMLPTDMDDNTLMVLDFGDAFFAFVYGVAAGGLPNMGRPLIYGVDGVINGSTINGKPIEYAGMELDAEFGMNGSLPHVVGHHRTMEEAHVYEDVMQLVDWVLDDKPTNATAEHARHVVEIFDAAYRSAETAQAQTLRTTF